MGQWGKEKHGRVKGGKERKKQQKIGWNKERSGQIGIQRTRRKEIQSRVGGKRSNLENTGSIILSWVFDSWYLKNKQIKKMDFQKYFEITV